MIRALVIGRLYGSPQTRTSAAGKAFSIAKVKADDKGGAWVWVSVIAFGAEAERLLELKAVSGNGAHIEGLRLRRNEELVRSHEELVRNSLPNSEVYSIENYELSKNEELLDISTDFPCSQADNSAAIKSCERKSGKF